MRIHKFLVISIIILFLNYGFAHSSSPQFDPITRELTFKNSGLSAFLPLINYDLPFTLGLEIKGKSHKFFISEEKILKLGNGKNPDIIISLNDTRVIKFYDNFDYIKYFNESKNYVLKPKTYKGYNIITSLNILLEKQVPTETNFFGQTYAQIVGFFQNLF